MEYFSMSKRSYHRIVDGDDDVLVSIRYKAHVKRQRLDPRGMELLETLANLQVEMASF